VSPPSEPRTSPPIEARVSPPVDPRGIEIERRASSIPPAVVHAVFDVGPEPPPVRASAEDETPLLALEVRPGSPPPRRHAQHHSKAPPHPPRRTSRPPAEENTTSLDDRISLINDAALPLLSAPPTDAPVSVTPEPRRAKPWLAVFASAILIVLAGVVLGARTRGSRATAVAALPEPAAPAHVAAAPASAAVSPAHAALALPSEPPGTAPAGSLENLPASDEAGETPEPAAREDSASAPLAPVSSLLSAGAAPRAPALPAEKAAAPVAPSDLPAFDAAAASAAISAAFERAAACRQPTDPSGSVTATLTYAPSGRVTTALVSGAFAGTSIGGCIAGQLRGAKVPPFSGDYISVRRSVVLK
jgi:hypothetical protein